MTTIAFDGRYVAADGRCTNGNMIVGKAHRKLWLIKAIVRGKEEEVVLAGAGAFEDLTVIKNWLEQGGDFFSQDPEATVPEIKPESVEGFIVTQSGEVFSWESGLVALEQEVPAMGGSGGIFAVSAMLCGKSAPDAIKVAMELDIATGGKILCFDTKTWQFVDPDTLEPHQVA